MSGETELATLLASMQPELHEGGYGFSTMIEPTDADLRSAVVVVSEREGITLVQPADASAPDCMAWITLTVHSSLQAVGLTAAVASALAERGIACNVVAGFHHDHLFVPYERRGDAIEALAELSR